MDVDPAVTSGLPKAGYLVPVAAVTLGITLLILERVRPLRKSTRPFARRFLTNACMTAMAVAAGAVIARFV